MINFKVNFKGKFSKTGFFYYYYFSVIIRGLFAFVIALWVQNFIVKI